ncbi:hypothetical protein KEM56_001911 [Ascosphaera pollenicola]|nr:hypothetical protein KEM56_001911 [Ascosphaera pollenicola]
MALLHLDPSTHELSSHSLSSPPNPFLEIPFIRRKLTAMTIAEKRRAAAKEASHYIFQVVKSGWSYDALRQSEGRDREHEPPSHVPPSQEQLDRVTEWRDRGCDSASDIEDVDEEEVKKKQKKTRTKSREEKVRRQSQLEADIAAARKARDVVIAERRRHRRQIELDEMTWNEGLRLWSYQRDAWTGAKLRHQTVQPTEPEENRADIGSETSTPVTPVDTLDETITHDGSVSQTGENHEPHYTVPRNTDDADHAADEPIVPVMRPYLPKSNPLVASIKPSCYPSIYTKVVKQGMTPAVPINLSDMTQALVEGWRKDGEWPPPSTAPIIVPRAPKKEKSKDKGNSKTYRPSPPAARRLSATLTGAVKKAWNFSMHPSYHFHLKNHNAAAANKTTAIDDKEHEKASAKASHDVGRKNSDRRHSIANPLAHPFKPDDMHPLQPVHSVASDPGSSVPSSMPVLSPHAHALT